MVFSFRSKLLLGMLVVGLLPLLAITALAEQSTRAELTDLSVKNLTERATSTADELDTYLFSRLEGIVMTAKLPAIVRYAAAGHADALAREGARAALAAVSSRAREYESVRLILSMAG